MKIALCLIVSAVNSEALLLRQALKSAEGHVDGIFLYLNHKSGVEPSKEIIRIAKSFTKNYTINEWTYFGDARNKNFAMVPEDYDFIAWMDTDDIWNRPEKLHQVAAATPRHIDGVYMAYEYDHDEFNNVIVEHYVARLVRNNASYAWSDKKLHESLEPIRHSGKAINEEVRIIHQSTPKRRIESSQRNLAMLEEELKGEGETPDPRTLFYLGTSYIDVGRYDEAKDLLSAYLTLSGYAEERAEAWNHLAYVYEVEGNVSEMKKCYLHAINENPKDPTAFVEMGKVEIMNELWGKSVEWLKMALAKESGPMTTTNNSLQTTYKAYIYLADCYKNMGGKNLDLAYEYAKKALDMRPNDTTREYFELIEKIINHRTMTEGVIATIKELEIDKPEAIENFIFSLPDNLRDNPAVLRYKKRHSKPKVWGKKSIVLFCGNSILGIWGPWSLEEGIGGSEEAVIRLSKKLKDQGWDVWVYATPAERAGNYEGVEWRNYWELNLADTFDVFVAWRSPWFYDIEINARKKYLWLHDVMEPEEFGKNRLDNLNKVIVLSKYHRSLFPMIPDEKILLSANGIDPEDFEIKQEERNPHRIIYMSSHVRGLQLLFEVWDDVKKAIPDAVLDIYYGWGSYKAVNRDNPERMAWMQKMQDWVHKLDGVTDHGKVGQDVIVQEIMKSGIWAYPCPFPEIFCITALKAQAGGAIPVSSDFAALEETVNFGTKIHMKAMSEKTPIGQWDKEQINNFRDALITSLKVPKEIADKLRIDMMAKTRINWSWEKVAEAWTAEMK